MKKFTMIVFVILCVFSFSGCKKEKEVSSTTEVATGVEVASQANDTVTDDVYGSNSSLEPDTSADYHEAPGTLVTDQVILDEFQTIIDKFYYNFLFAPKSETGEITEMDMQLFAISYIYQNEYADLRFDADKFVLYIPDTNVSEIIKRFFDVEFVNHKYPVDSKITYEDGYYVMPARDEQIGPSPIISEVYKISDFDYRFTYTSAKVGTTVEEYEVVLEEREGRYIMLNYRKITDTDVQATEATTAPATQE